MITRFDNFEIICKKCGSKDVEVFVTIHDQAGFECKNCNIREKKTV